jgi:hypothetical protein
VLGKAVVKRHKVPPCLRRSGYAQAGVKLFQYTRQSFRNFCATGGLSLSPGGLFLLRTMNTPAIKLHAMVQDLEAVTLGDPFLQRFEGVILELNNLSAFKADQMIMMGFRRNRFIPGLSVIELPLGGQAEAGEKLQGPVYRGIPDLRVFLRDLGMNLREVTVSGGVEKHPENLFPLPGRFQPFFGNFRLEQRDFQPAGLFEIEIQFHLCPNFPRLSTIDRFFFPSPFPPF